MDLSTTTIMMSNPGIIQKRFRTLLGSKYHIQQLVTKYGSIKYYNSFNKPPQKQISDSFSSLIFSIFLETISDSYLNKCKLPNYSILGSTRTRSTVARNSRLTAFRASQLRRKKTRFKRSSTEKTANWPCFPIQLALWSGLASAWGYLNSLLLSCITIYWLSCDLGAPVRPLAIYSQHTQRDISRDKDSITSWISANFRYTSDVSDTLTWKYSEKDANWDGSQHRPTTNPEQPAEQRVKEW